MNQIEHQNQDFNRRDFLKGGSVATLMTMLGGVELFAQTNGAPAEAKPSGPKVKVAVIGLGSWGREIINTLGRIPQADIAAICDTYAASVRRASTSAPAAKQTEDYKTILADKEIKAVVIATPTHLHKEITLAALAAGKQVYCEAPLANTIDDAKAIALAAKAAKEQIFQAGLQMRSDTQRQFLLPFIRSGAIGQFVMARAQWHRKQSWRATSPKPEREKELNWRLAKATSLGLVGELGIHAIDQAAMYLNMLPTAVSGFGSVCFWKDGREVPDTIQSIVEFQSGVNMIYDATLANSFDAEYEVLFGSDAAVLMRESKAWLFKEVDAALLGWEVYASKETFYKETGIVLKAGASKSVQQPSAAQEEPYVNTPLSFALTNFLRNSADLMGAAEDYTSSYGDDKAGLLEALAKVNRRPAAGFLEGYQATVTAIKSNEAVMSGQRITIPKNLYELA
ncbi:MAG TPA: Gfo/Idh/MocA family oxidoreductase [Verrucomicrobiae bacterium]